VSESGVGMGIGGAESKHAWSRAGCVTGNLWMGAGSGGLRAAASVWLCAVEVQKEIRDRE
jgi:hypothetical protein